MGNAVTTNAPTAYIDPWLVGQTVVAQTGGNNYFDGSLDITNTIGVKVTDPVTVQLFDKNCVNKESNTSAVVSIQNLVSTPASFGYEVKIDQSLIGADTVIGTYVTCSPQSGSSCSVGTIEFCTRVSTFIGSIEVAFRETNFNLGFNLTDNAFSLPSIGISENDPDSFITDVDTDFDVDACQCENFVCATPSIIAQDENLVMCIYPVHGTDPSQASNVKITNFNIDIDAGDGSGFSYRPVVFGTNAWNNDALTDVAEDGNDFTIMISTPIIAQFFIQNVNTIDVNGNAFLEFKSGKDAATQFGKYAMEVALRVDPELGCLSILIKQVRALF